MNDYKPGDYVKYKYKDSIFISKLLKHADHKKLWAVDIIQLKGTEKLFDTAWEIMEVFEDKDVVDILFNYGQITEEDLKTLFPYCYI